MASIAELYLEQGRRQGEYARRRGEQSAQLLSNLAGVAGQAIGSIAQERQQAPIRKQEATIRDLQAKAANANIAQDEAQTAALGRQASDQRALDTAMGSGLDLPTIEAALQKAGSGHLIPTVRKSWNDAETAAANLKSARAKAEDAEKDYWGALAAGVQPHLGEEDGGLGAARIALQHAKQTGYADADRYLEQITDPGHLKTTIEGLIKASPTYSKLAGEEQDRALRTADVRADNARAEAAAVEAARHNEAQERIATMGAGRAEAAQAETARHNLAMEESAKNAKTARPVIAGDAEDLAAIDEGLKLAGSLNFTPSDTGILPSIGGAMPDPITNLTGFGVGAKQRAGVINLVKQIIGKGLEGGVLRKEDESKYAKILPTLSDPPEVVKAKIANLKTTLTQKRAVRLDAMEDAGYDVSKFRARGGVAQPPPSSETPEQRAKRLYDELSR